MNDKEMVLNKFYQTLTALDYKSNTDISEYHQEKLSKLSSVLSKNSNITADTVDIFLKLNDFMPTINDSQKIKINELTYVISDEQQEQSEGNELSCFIVSVNSRAINETTQEVFYKQTDTKLSLIKEENEWKINDFEVIK